MEIKGNIGVFDSGLGGLWILKHLKDKLGDYDYVFLGDQANVPYGGKSEDELFNIATKALDFLYGEKNCAGVILACNTISSTIYDRLRIWKDEKYFGRILFGIVRPTIDSIDKDLIVTIFATPRTCSSDVYERFFKENIREYKKIALDKLAYLIETGGDVASYIQGFKSEIISGTQVGALLCTHYGIVKSDFEKVFPDVKKWICQEEILPQYIEKYFNDFQEREAFFSHNKTVSLCVTKSSDIFKSFKDKWFGEDLKIDIINL